MRILKKVLKGVAIVTLFFVVGYAVLLVFVPFSYKTVLPAYSDELAYGLGLLDTRGPNGGTLTLEEMRGRY